MKNIIILTLIKLIIYIINNIYRDISYNNIQRFPKAIGQLTLLEKLYNINNYNPYTTILILIYIYLYIYILILLYFIIY